MNKFSYVNSSINPNSSSTNLSHLGVPTGGAKSKLYQPQPIKFSQFQLPSPPISKVSSPIDTHAHSQSSLLASWLPPINWKVSILCFNWYLASIFSNNSTKLILNQFSHPVTLTQVQFLLNCLFCLLLLSVLSYKGELIKTFPAGVVPNDISVRRFIVPTKLIISTTLPMGCFQFVGHLTSHKATSLIAISFVHTIKALAPLATVIIYRVFFHKKISKVTYFTLTPLVLGIMLTCYKPGGKSEHSAGYAFAFISMAIFVSQNIYSKKTLTVEKQDLLPGSQNKPKKKLEKLTILFYCSLIGFVFTLPIYLISELSAFSLKDMTVSVLLLMILNGLSHFVQSLLAFQILGLMSPINYSIANIMKRIIIIVVAFVVEGKSIAGLQGYGLVLTIAGLYCYDRWGVPKV